MKINIKQSFSLIGRALKVFFSIANVKNLLGKSYEGAVIFLVYFIISEILISGGLYANNIYLEIVTLIIVISLTAFFLAKKLPGDRISAIKRGFANLTSFAILDFLLSNLLLNDNSGSIYKYWGTLTTYAVILVLPFLIYYLKNRKITATESIS